MANTTNKTVSTSVRLPEELNNKLVALAEETGYSKSAIIIDILEKKTPIYIAEGKKIALLLYEIKSKIFSSEQNKSKISQTCDEINNVLFDIITKYLTMEDNKNVDYEND